LGHKRTLKADSAMSASPPKDMKRFFGQAALLTALLSGFIAPAFGNQTTPSTDSVKAFALEWFEHLQAGQIDRTQMTTAFSEHLTDDAVKEMSRYLKSYGPATKSFKAAK
jgi:hypothetical protein